MMDGNIEAVWKMLQQIMARSEANEALNHPGPWVVMSLDPLIQGPHGVAIIGPFDDFFEALRAADTYADDLNHGIGGEDPPWVTHVMPLWSNDLEGP